MKKLSPLLIGLTFTCLSHAQVELIPLESLGSSETGSIKYRRNFSGFHGYYLTSGEIIPVQHEIFEELITSDDIPIVQLNSGYSLGWMSMMHNWWFTSISYSYNSDESAEQDSLVSTLNQNSIAARFGYNIIRRQGIVVSPYVDLRYTRFRHQTSLNEKVVSLDDYMLVRDIDLRVGQFSGAIGINTTFVTYNNLSFGFYASYLIHLGNNPIISTPGNRIKMDAGNPLDNFVIGMGMGMGFNVFD